MKTRLTLYSRWFAVIRKPKIKLELFHLLALRLQQNNFQGHHQKKEKIFWWNEEENVTRILGYINVICKFVRVSYIVA